MENSLKSMYCFERKAKEGGHIVFQDVRHGDNAEEVK